MISISKAGEDDYLILAEMGRRSFIESHGHSASAADINNYVEAKYNADVCKAELNAPAHIYHLIYCNGQVAGYSKLLYNVPHANIAVGNVCKLDRIYLLKEFYGQKLGLELLNFNIELSKQNSQAGMWLFVWTENHRAVQFYQKTGFRIIGHHDFKLTENHANPNHQMLLMY